ncbi:MAG: flagellar hook-basal body complex protein FliE [Alphaproteobacteria bacterium]|nr:flagellar hook-basal body complex protein FliE [Alphaproteobacteria bacterium]
MVLNVSDIMSVYKKTGGIIDDAGASASPAGGQSFGSMVKGFLGDGIASLHEGEKAATSAVSGKADLASVVTAMDNAEVVLNEITAIRDKVLAAYKDITSTAI